MEYIFDYSEVELQKYVGQYFRRKSRFYQSTILSDEVYLLFEVKRITDPDYEIGALDSTTHFACTFLTTVSYKDQPITFIDSFRDLEHFQKKFAKVNNGNK